MEQDSTTQTLSFAATETFCINVGASLVAVVGISSIRHIYTLAVRVNSLFPGLHPAQRVEEHHTTGKNKSVATTYCGHEYTLITPCAVQAILSTVHLTSVVITGISTQSLSLVRHVGAVTLTLPLRSAVVPLCVKRFMEKIQAAVGWVPLTLQRRGAAVISL